MGRPWVPCLRLCAFCAAERWPSIAPTFGVEGMMGTNPLCFGIPTDEEFPFVIDCATSVNQRGKIERYGREGKETPAGQVIDLEGNQRTDTEGILLDMVAGKAALCPLGGAGEEMGGYKGFGWAATVELLCTAFQSGPWGADICGIDRATGASDFVVLDARTMSAEPVAVVRLPQRVPYGFHGTFVPDTQRAKMEGLGAMRSRL